jgi:hypothetical protein
MATILSLAVHPKKIKYSSDSDWSMIGGNNVVWVK